jgi:hypothetical protein
MSLTIWEPLRLCPAAPFLLCRGGIKGPPLNSANSSAALVVPIIVPDLPAEAPASQVYVAPAVVMVVMVVPLPVVIPAPAVVLLPAVVIPVVLVALLPGEGMVVMPIVKEHFCVTPSPIAILCVDCTIVTPLSRGDFSK